MLPEGLTRGSEFEAACAVLGISTTPSPSEAKTAFRVRAALLHPDVHQHSGTQRMNAATAAMQQLSDAYQLVLEALVAGDWGPTRATPRPQGMTGRCTRCRTDVECAPTDADPACPACGRRLQVRWKRAPGSGRGPGGGRVVVYTRRPRPRARPRTEPRGGMCHIGLWYDEH